MTERLTVLEDRRPKRVPEERIKETEAGQYLNKYLRILWEEIHLQLHKDHKLTSGITKKKGTLDTRSNTFAKEKPLNGAGG